MFEYMFIIRISHGCPLSVECWNFCTYYVRVLVIFPVYKDVWTHLAALFPSLHTRVWSATYRPYHHGPSGATPADRRSLYWI
jgi:hypothetical protein